MPGQLIPKGDRKWLVRFFRGRNPKTGKKKYFNKLVYGNKKDAQIYLNKLLRDIDQGTFVDPTALTLDDYLDRWLETAAKPRLAPLTFDHYKDVLRRYVRPALGSHKISNLRPLDVQTLYSGLQARKLSGRIVRYTHAVLNSALKQAVKWGLISQNPASLVELPKKERKEMQAMTPEQAAKFLAAAESDRFGVLFRLAVLTGMRPSEYFGFQWKDINFETGVISVQRTLTWKRDGTWYFGEPKTSRSRRSIPIPSSLLMLLKEHKRKQAEERLKAGADYQSNNLVFAGKEGKPLMLHNLMMRHFKPILKRAELPQSFRLYDLRHTCATLLLVADENPKW
jgi:integrase